MKAVPVIRVYLYNLIFFCAFPIIASTQATIALPEITNFSREKMNAGAQTWQISQDRLGNMYFANNSGLLTYNGKEWKVFRVPNKTIVRCLVITSDDRVYVGAQDEIGYFFPDGSGTLRYHSLNSLIAPQNRAFGDIWYVSAYKNDVFFQSGSKIFRLNNKSGKIETYEAPGGTNWSFMGVSNNTLYAKIGFDNLLYFNGSNWNSIHAEVLRDKFMTSMLDYGKDTFLISTLNSGIFLLAGEKTWQMNIPPELVSSQIFKALKIDNEVFALATVSGGVYFLNKKGQILRHFSSANGMQNNNVLNIFLDSHSNLWAGLDEGIDLINYNSSFQKIIPLPGVAVPVYTAHVFQSRLWLATSNGLYFTNLGISDSSDLALSQGQFSKVTNTERQVWSLFDNGEHLLMAHHYGAYMIDNNKSELLDNNNNGSWLFRKVPGSGNIIAGVYNGVELFHNEKKRLVSTQLLANSPKEPLRFIEIDSATHTLWASHPYRGVYEMKMSDDYEKIISVRLFTQKDGLPNDLNNFVFKINGQIIFTTENGIYEFDNSHQHFIASKKFYPFFGNTMVKYIANDTENRIWFATEKDMGVVENNTVKYFPELTGQLIAGFENIYPFNSNNIFIGSYKGLIHLNYNSYKKRNTGIAAILNKVVAIGKVDSLLYNGFFVFDNKISEEQNRRMIYSLPPSFNSFHFEFSSNFYSYSDKIQYSYMLDGYDKNWSEWSAKTDKDYTNLSYGTYTFNVKAKDNLGNISKPVRYIVEIRPKWFQTKLAYVIYLLLIASLFFVVNKILGRRLKKQQEKFLTEQKHMKYVHELELEHNEREIIQLKTEHLETEMMYKNKELASTTMHLYKRGRLLGKIREDLSDGIKRLKTKEEKSGFNKLLKLISEEEKQDSDWDQFAIHFDDVHNRFLYKMKRTYPDLTPSDLKICAYLKMNLSSKEIAQLLNISLKGVEIGRYRLRKKLKLSQNQNLTSFIGEFNPDE